MLRLRQSEGQSNFTRVYALLVAEMVWTIHTISAKPISNDLGYVTHVQMQNF